MEDRDSKTLQQKFQGPGSDAGQAWQTVPELAQELGVGTSRLYRCTSRLYRWPQFQLARPIS